MKQFCVKPTIKLMENVEEFCKEYAIGEGDLFIINDFIYDKFFAGKTEGAVVIDDKKYGSGGEPTDLVVEGIYADVKGNSFKRVIAVGGGTILDIAKLFSLRHISPVVDLYERKLEIVKDKQLILVPTTCGTGSEMTNISILELTTRHTKMGLAVDELYADEAILIPELVAGLPFRFFAASSIDALIHSIESFTSPKASVFTRMYSEKAMGMILNAFKEIAANGPEARIPLLSDLLVASTYAGIAFGNAGCAAVHAMSYPLGAKYHVPHGESNYAMFTGVYKTYMRLDPDGGIDELNQLLARHLGCKPEQVYEEIEVLLNHLIPKKALHEYGVTKEDLDDFTEVVMTKQGRLMNNNYTTLDANTVHSIYEELY